MSFHSSWRAYAGELCILHLSSSSCPLWSGQPIHLTYHRSVKAKVQVRGRDEVGVPLELE